MCPMCPIWAHFRAQSWAHLDFQGEIYCFEGAIYCFAGAIYLINNIFIADKVDN